MPTDAQSASMTTFGPTAEWDRRTEGPVPRAKPYSDPVLSHCFTNGVQYLKGKSAPVFHCSTVVVRSLVHDVLNKLVYQVSSRAMNFDAIETRADRIAGRVGVEFDVVLNFWLWD